jgi:hypothetical protein
MTFIRLFVFLCCCFVFNTLLAQTGLEEQIEAAKAELKRAEALYSKQHILYADQALILADLYFQSYQLIQEGEEDANALAKEALRFYRDSLGQNSPRYYEALKIIPADHARFYHLQMNLEDARKDSDRNLAFHLLEMAKFKIEEEFRGGVSLPLDAYSIEIYQLLIEAYALLKKSAAQELNLLFEDIPPSITKLVELHLQLQAMQKEPFSQNSNVLQEADLETSAQLEKFVEFILQLQRILENYRREVNNNLDLLPFSEKEVYIGLRKTLNNYKFSDPKAFQAFYRKLPKDFQKYYDIESAFWEGIDQHKTTDDQFYKDFKRLLYEMKEGLLMAYVNYSIDETFERVLEDIRLFQAGGKQNPYYQKVMDMQRLQRLSGNERYIEEERIALKELKANLKHFSEEYIDRLIKLAIIEFDEVQEDSAFTHFQQAIFIARKMDKGLTAEDEFRLDLGEDLDTLDLDFGLDEDIDLGLDDEDLIDLLPKVETSPKDSLPKVVKKQNTNALEQKYMAKIPKAWQQIIRNEDEIFNNYWNDELKILSYLNAARHYLKAAILEGRAEDYMKEALDLLRDSSSVRAEALEIIKAIALEDWETKHSLYNLFEYKNLILTHFSRADLEPFIRDVLKKVETHYGSREQNYAQVLALAADINYLDDAPQSNIYALGLYRKALDLYLRTEGKYYGYFELLKSMTAKAQETSNDWPVETMAAFFEDRLQIAKEIDLESGDLGWNYFEALQTYVDWHYKQNRYVSAEAKIKELILVLNSKGEDAQKQYKYASAVHNLARIYRKTGRLKLSFKYYKKAIQYAIDFEEYSLTLEAMDGLGLLLQDVGEYERALETFDQCLDYLEGYEAEGKIDRMNRFKDALNYIKILRHIGRVYLDMGAYDQAMDYYQKVIDFEEESDLLDFELDYSLKADLALWYDFAFEEEKAEFYYKNAIDGLKDLDEVSDALVNLADFYIRRGQDSLARPQLLKALDLDLRRLRDNYSNLAEEERLLFLNTIMPRVKRFYRFVARQNDEVLVKRMLNTHLIIKGLALENTTNIHSVIYASENVKLKNIYGEMQLLRQKVAAAASLSQQERLEQGIDISRLNEEIKAKEEALSRESKTLRGLLERQNKQVNFSGLQKILGKDAVAIDFILIQEKNEFADLEDYYYAFLIRPQDSFPKLLRLCLAEDLNFELNTEVNPSGLNYITDPSKSYYLYSLVWEPMAEYLKDYKNIHICPTGTMAKIAFTTLRVDDFSGQRLMDDHSLFYHTALRDLLERPVQEGSFMSSKPDILLVGGVRFNIQEEELRAALEFTPTTVDTSNLEGYGRAILTSGTQLREAFNYLPGTLKEINKIESVFEGYHWDVRSAKGIYALEEAISSQIRQKPPTILHIATHGFFFPPYQEDLNFKENEQNPDEETVEDRLAKEVNPLLRSGLALAGINHIWRGGARVSGLQDGIFTAYEVANLDLFNTELVVLSACETGDGDINNNEGVMGLQRAFKMAGANRLIISLWKVPDFQTSELMTLFYENYLNEQMLMHEAFEKAQHEMRRRYSNPYYWAAFILVE